VAVFLAEVGEIGVDRLQDEQSPAV